MNTTEIREALEQAVLGMAAAVTAGDFEEWRKQKNIVKDMKKRKSAGAIIAENERATQAYNDLITELEQA